MEIVSESEVQNKVDLVLGEWPNLTVVTSVKEAEMVGAYLIDLKDARARIDKFFDENIARAHQLHKGLVAKKKQVESPVVEAQTKYRQLVTNWNVAEQQRVQREQQEADRKAQAEADRIARLLAQEEARLAAEQAKIDAEAARAAMAAAKAEGDKKALAKAKQDAEDAKIEAERAKAREAAIKAGTVKIEAEKVTAGAVEQATKIKGASLTATWGAEVTDLVALCKWIGTGKNGTAYVDANMSALNAVMKATKGQVVIPGVKAVEKFGNASR